MDTEEVELVDSLLRRRLGQSIEWEFYDRALNSPLNFVVQRAEQQLKRPFQVCWVDGAPPDMYSLQGFSQPLAVYCTRYVEVWADIRGLVATDVWGEGILERLAASHCLELMAECSLQANDPDLAGILIIESLLRQEGIVRIPNRLANLEHEPISFGYIATWFYGLLHELGHVRNYDDTTVFTEQWIIDATEDSLGQSGLSDAVREEAMIQIRSGDASFLLHAGNLRSEGLADLFAASVFFRSMYDLNAPSNAHVDLVDFAGALLCELLLSINIVAIFERCRRIALHASTGFPTQAKALDAVLHPVALDVRTKFVLSYQRRALAVFLFGSEPSERQLAAVDMLIDGALKSVQPNLKRFEAGMNAAISFAADRERRTTFAGQLGNLGHHLRSSAVAAADRATIERFVARAYSLKRHTPLFDALLAQARDVQQTPAIHLPAVRTLKCAWVDGPNGYNSPFGLETRYGFLIFAFSVGSQIYELFAEVSKADLAPGFELKAAMVAADTDEALRDALAKHLPIGSEFVVVVEGTKDFDTYIRELSEGTIWPDHVR